MHGFTPIHHGRALMGVDHGGQGEQVPPEFGAENLFNPANCSPPPPDFVTYKNERSVAFKIRQSPPDPLVGWRGDTPPHTPLHSARTHLRCSPCAPLPQKSSQIYTYACSVLGLVYFFPEWATCGCIVTTLRRD